MTCHCRFCNPTVVQMFVCPDCGCKRCPKAESHAAACTGRQVSGAHSCSGCQALRDGWSRAVYQEAFATSQEAMAKAMEILGGPL